MRGITSAAGYVPSHRLDRSTVAAVMGSGGGRGQRAVASPDEDTTTMGVEAARLARRGGGGAPGSLWFATTDPAYLDKTNAAALHAALQLPATVPAFDFGGALRSGVGALSAALSGAGVGPVLVVSADRRDGLPTGADESNGGDAAAAVLVADDTDPAPVLAAYLGGAAVTTELVDRWRRPGDRRAKVWEERFGETSYLGAGIEAWHRALESTGLEAGQIDRAVVTGMHGRAVKSVAAKLGLRQGALADDLSGSVGQAGTAHPLLLLASVLEEEAAGYPAGGRTVAVVHLADGADVLLLRTTTSIGAWRPALSVSAQVAAGAPVPYGKFLSWRGMVTVEPPRRPEPPRVSSSAAFRSTPWKFGFVGSRDRGTGALHLPPARVSRQGGAFDDMEPVPMADAVGTIVTFTVDRMAYSPNPPIVFAVVDFDGGGRFPIELTDVAADQVAIGGRVELTFRRLFTADDIPDYFYKARPVRGAVDGVDTDQPDRPPGQQGGN
jgi:3-hydroxy-3-methylglutaryl CoA synthase/uncharacterized OB-fold protein